MLTPVSRHGGCLLLVFVGLVLPAPVSAGDWPTFAHDPQRTGWARSERTLTTGNVANLELKWKTQVNNRASLLGSLTAPIVAVDVPTARGEGDVVYVAGKEGGVFAMGIIVRQGKPWQGGCL